MDSDKIWWAVFAGICFIISLPLVGDYGLALFPLGRDIIFRVVVEIILVLLIMGGFKFKVSRLGWALVLFAVVGGLATLFSSQPLFSFFGNPFRGHGYFSWLHLLAFFFIVVNFFKHEDEKRFLLWLIVGVSFLVGGISFFESGRAQSTLNNPNFFSAYLLLPLFLTVGMLFKRERPFLLVGEGWKAKAFLILNLCVGAWGVYLSKSRGAYVGLGAGALTFLFFYLWNRIERRRVFLIGLVLLSFVSVFLLRDKIMGVWDIVTSPIEEIEGRGISIRQRVESYRAALLGIREKPLLGYGPENFTVAFDQFYSGSLASTSYAWFDKVHNLFLEIGVTTGLLGLLSFFVVLFFAFRNLLPLDTTLKIGILSALVAYLVQNMFNIDSTTTLIYFYLFLALT